MLLNVEYLTELMKEKGWSVRQLASKSGLSSAAISRIITGKKGAGTRALTGIRRTFPEEPIERLFILPKQLLNDIKNAVFLTGMQQKLSSLFYIKHIEN